MSFLFIAHDLKVACYFCDRIGVMYKGELMEEASAKDLYQQAFHPYTQLLFSSAAGLAQERAQERAAERAPESAEKRIDNLHSSSNSGDKSCSFAPRCPLATEQCFNEHPEMRKLNDGHSIRCFNK